MAMAALLSQHSSNPLEVGSSDPHNAAYKKTLAATKRRNFHESEPLSSDDPLNSFTAETSREYQKEMEEIVPAERPFKRPRLSHPIAPQYSDDELTILGKDGLPIEDFDASHDEGLEDADGLADEDFDDSKDAEGDIDEELTIFLRPKEERLEIEEEIADLEQAVPQLKEDYKLVDRLGNGTFSSVYKAVDVGYHDKWDNSPWQGNHPPTSSAYYQSAPHLPGTKVFVAIKRIYVTSSPERIRNEIAILEDCRGSRHVSQLITAFRHKDQVVAIIPYQRNDDFRDFFRDLPLPCVKAYFRCMLRAFRDIHARKIIHRDVKPANFLFDPKTGIGTLCDFGLASRMDNNISTNGACFHTSASAQYPHGRLVSKGESSAVDIKNAQTEARRRSHLPAERVGYPEKDTRPISKANRAGTRGFRAPEVLLKCGDQTGAIDVWAAGVILLFFLTGKFPLFQANDDTEALMELAAVMGRKNIEKAATLHSRVFITNVPSVTNEGTSWKDFVVRQNPDLYEPKASNSKYWPYNTPAYTARQRTSAEPTEFAAVSTPARSRSHYPPSTSSSPPLEFPLTSSPSRYSPGIEDRIPPDSKEQLKTDLDKAFDLLDGLLHPESIKRLTPQQALAHPFLKETRHDYGGDDTDAEEEPDDDEFVPHLWGVEGQAVCREMHSKDEIGNHLVKVLVPCDCNCGELHSEVDIVEAGQGIAIGRQPCEIHEKGGDY